MLITVLVQSCMLSCKFLTLPLNLQLVRFLVEGNRGAVLHTGDFRAEPWFLESITRNPILQPYLSPTAVPSHSDVLNEDVSPVLTRTLEAIYLDTACVMSELNIPSKVCRSVFSLHFELTSFILCRHAPRLD